ncbi:Fibrillin-1 [Stylophora pistillata]|uniref:Fibrillin-1 n=1 Tax=Stylophora pistillata TaxID=50429 RepID=A0A2B4RAN5_STYPI|nr:Fibrillin-1 [Stylophora pistillata]
MNFYKLESSKYNDLIEKNITKSYKKVQPETTQAIHKQNKDIATKLGIDDRVDTTANKDAFITLKDHKPNFTNKPTCRLINPTKSEIGKVSKDIDECSQNSHNCSNITATCNNTKGTFKTSCKPGFSGDGNNCTDIDECSQNIHNCSNITATCSNIVGAFKCVCKPGFIGDGHNCTGREIKLRTWLSSFCTFVDQDEVEYYKETNSENIDECVNNTHNCSKGSATCRNTEGSFNCSCDPGLTGDGYTCQDINECVQGTHDWNRGNATCLNTEGSFSCSCKPGFTGDGHNCQVYKDCAEVYKNRHHIDEIYTNDPDGEGAFDVFCNQEGSQGGWTVFQRKSSDSIDFNRDWIDYKNGFGNLYGDFWLGLDKVHRLTKSDNYKLILYWKMENSEVHRFRFDHFEVESEDTWYKLRVEVSGNDWGPLKDSNGQTFTTGDQDSNGHTGFKVQYSQKNVNTRYVGFSHSTLPIISSLHQQCSPPTIGKEIALVWRRK